MALRHQTPAPARGTKAIGLTLTVIEDLCRAKQPGHGMLFGGEPGCFRWDFFVLAGAMCAKRPRGWQRRVAAGDDRRRVRALPTGRCRARPPMDMPITGSFGLEVSARRLSRRTMCACVAIHKIHARTIRQRQPDKALSCSVAAHGQLSCRWELAPVFRTWCCRAAACSSASLVDLLRLPALDQDGLSLMGPRLAR